MFKSLLCIVLLLQLGCAPVSVPSYYSSVAVRDGAGSAVLPDGALYTGEFRNGLFDGQGTLQYNNGDHYEGRFEEGLLQGFGVLQMSNGASYEGEFARGHFEGQGELNWAQGDGYKGEFRGDRMEGEGTYTHTNGDRFIGEFASDQPAGKGRIEYASGDRYEGEWQGWELAGEGVYVDSFGTSYKGSFADYTFSGSGEITKDDGEQYTGEVEDWSPHGEGVIKMANGDHYEGEFKRGRYSGGGVLKSANGDRYQGQFRAGKFHGEGTLIHRIAGEQQTLSGKWKRGLYTGAEWQDHLATGFAAADREQLLFDQKQLLDQALGRVASNNAAESELYALTFAGHGEQNVFRLEADTARSRLLERFTVPERTLSMVNNASTTADQPLATTTNLRYALDALSQKMDLENDLLFLLLTSHGSKTHELSVNLPGAPLHNLGAQELAAMLDEAGIRWRVVVVSACYSGGFIKPLQSAETLIIASARHDRTSFGCSDDATMTYFGGAYFDQALRSSSNFVTAFGKAKELVAEREQNAGYEPSEPQIFVGERIEQKLSQIRTNGRKVVQR